MRSSGIPRAAPMRCSRPAVRPRALRLHGSDDSARLRHRAHLLHLQRAQRRLPGGRREVLARSPNGEYTISFEFLPAQADAQREQLVRRLGAEDDSIDIIGMDVIWTAEFANAGWIQPWEGARRSRSPTDVFESVVETARFEDKLYAAPFTSNTQLLWYRKDRVDSRPKTWDEMVPQAEQIGPAKGQIQVQANRYEGFTVWVNAMIESAGTKILVGPDRGRPRRGADRARRCERWPSSPTPRRRPRTSTPRPRTPPRLGVRGRRRRRFMINYPFVYPSAKENAPDVFKQMGAAKLPARSTRQALPRRRSAGSTSGSRAYSEQPGPGVRGDRVPGPAREPARSRRRSAGCRRCTEDALRLEGDREGLPGLRGPDPPVDRGRGAAAARPPPTRTSRWRSSARSTRSATSTRTTSTQRLRRAARLRRAGRQAGGAALMEAPSGTPRPAAASAAATARPSASSAGCCARRRWSRCCWSPRTRSATRSCSRCRSSTCASRTRAASPGSPTTRRC